MHKVKIRLSICLSLVFMPLPLPSSHIKCIPSLSNFIRVPISLMGNSSAKKCPEDLFKLILLVSIMLMAWSELRLSVFLGAKSIVVGLFFGVDEGGVGVGHFLKYFFCA